jgi:cysteine desulfurase/selenocysteine lyase
MTATTHSTTADVMPFNVERIRADFPLIARGTARGKRLVYLDNAATSQKPQAVIDAEREYYEHDNANVHRGVHELSERATNLYEGVREKVRQFINAPEARQIIYTRGTTEGINLVAQAYTRPLLKAGDEIIVTEMEHHSNIVPWQIVCEQTGATLKVVPFFETGELDTAAYEKLLSERTKFVSLVHISNAMGTINPVAKMIRQAHAVGAKVLIDGAQSTPHVAIDVQALDADFFAFSGHKLFGPTGIGVLYGKAELLEAMPPYQAGGDMIHSVSFKGTTYAQIPMRFEAGTPHIAGVVGLGAAIDYLHSIDLAGAWKHEDELLAHATAAIRGIEGVKIIGTAPHKISVLSFVVDGAHPLDLGTMLDMDGIAIRTGHHCAQPVMDHFGVSATARASLAFYNTTDEVDAFIASLKKNIARLR